MTYPVLKVPLNPNQPTNSFQSQHISGCVSVKKCCFYVDKIVLDGFTCDFIWNPYVEYYTAKWLHVSAVLFLEFPVYWEQAKRKDEGCCTPYRGV